ncbi:MAG: hypothetical protein LBT53_08090 [Puniceicoccales bacterium]|jgi:hypothetical protein|nr:hypothetical protein [Puniceicoccales bacterium]
MLRSKERRAFGASSNSRCDGGDGDDGCGVAFVENFRLPKNGFPSKVAAVKTLPFLAALLLSGAALALPELPADTNAAAAPAAPADAKVAFRISDGGSLAAEFNAASELVSIYAGDTHHRASNVTRLVGCVVEGRPVARALADGGVEIRTVWRNPSSGATATLAERFTPDRARRSVRWAVEVTAPAGQAPFTAPVQVGLRFLGASPHWRFWTTWGDPRFNESSADWKQYNARTRANIHAAAAALKTANGRNADAAAVAPNAAGRNWGDPLLPQPLADAVFDYGMRPATEHNFLRYGMHSVPVFADVISVPLVTLFPSNKARSETPSSGETGITFAADPNDRSLDVTLQTSANGLLAFRHINHRIHAANPLHFHFDLTEHEADWRGGLRWMAKHYAEFFDVNVPLAHDVAGTGAYSSSPDLICENAEKLREVGLRVNWQASFDFPYMGMFIPPLTDDNAEWKTHGGWPMSIAKFRDGVRRVKAAGIHTLSYFNVTEFGKKVRWPLPEKFSVARAEIWRDGNAFLRHEIPGAIVRIVLPATNVAGAASAGGGGGGGGGPLLSKPYHSWEGCIVTDAGDPAYQDFLVAQARRHLEKLPDASGICIDRTDWIRYYNHVGDDGVSWWRDRPARALLLGWHATVGRIGKEFHAAGKVVFVNNHDKRLDAYKHADGYYDEHTQFPTSANLTAFAAIRKPALGWTRDAGDFRPDPDGYMQRFLYLGIFPTAPVPKNDHTITPGPVADKLYRDYAPLLLAMRGKKWVLAERAIFVVGGAAKANLFEVFGGYSAPVVFAGDRKQATLVLRGLAGVTAASKLSVLHPGVAAEIPVQAESIVVEKDGTALRVTVPLLRSCAMLRIRQ